MDDTSRPRATGWRAHTPNALTISRLGMTFFFLLALLTADPGGMDWSAGLLVGLVLFVVAALTDAVDGYLARRWNAVSRFGRVADPFADKILIMTGFVMLAGPNLGPHSGVASWMVVLILSRELLVTTIRGVYEAEGTDFSATASGKIKMVIQSVVIPAAIVDAAAPSMDGVSGPHPVTEGLLLLAVGVTVWSAVPYVVRACRAGREQGRRGG